MPLLSLRVTACPPVSHGVSGTAKGQETGSGSTDRRTSSCTSESQTGKRGWEQENYRRPSLNTYSRLEHKYFHKWAHHLGHLVPGDHCKWVSASGNSHGTTEQNFSFKALQSCSFRCRKASPRHHQMALLFLQIKTVAPLCPWNAIIDLGGKRS